MATFQTQSVVARTSEKQTPVQRFGRGDIQVVVWANRTWDGGLVHKATVSRRFRHRDGTWTSTTSFLKQELQQVIDVLEIAREEMID